MKVPICCIENGGRFIQLIIRIIDGKQLMFIKSELNGKNRPLNKKKHQQRTMFYQCLSSCPMFLHRSLCFSLRFHSVPCYFLSSSSFLKLIVQLFSICSILSPSQLITQKKIDKSESIIYHFPFDENHFAYGFDRVSVRVLSIFNAKDINCIELHFIHHFICTLPFSS